MLDLCTGTGCIPLLFHHEFYAARNDINLRAVGIDISNKALRLATHNHKRLRKDTSWVEQGSIAYMQADVLANPVAEDSRSALPVSTALRHARLPHLWDILISNPPYISPSEYWKTTTRSVRGFEPKLALVPPPKAGSSVTEQGDMFYQPIFAIAREVEAKILLLEVADLDQALRVGREAQALSIFDGVEIWREEPDEPHDPFSTTPEFPVLGQGNARSVVCWRGIGTTWLENRECAARAHSDVALSPHSGHSVCQLTDGQRASKHTFGSAIEVARDKSPAITTKGDATDYEPSNSTRWRGSLNEEQQKRLVEYYIAGWKGQAIADEFGIGTTTLYRYLHRLGPFPERKMKKTKPQTKITKQLQERIVQYHITGWKAQAIADELGISPSTLYTHLHRLGPYPTTTTKTIKPPRQITKELQERLAQYYIAGWKAKAIADELDICMATVSRYARRLGLPERTKKTKRSTKKTPEEVQERLVQYYIAGWKPQAIADELNVSRSTVWRYFHSLRKFPSKTPTKSQYGRMTEENLERLVQYYHAGWKRAAIADELNISQGTLSRYLSRLGISGQHGDKKKN